MDELMFAIITLQHIRINFSNVNLEDMDGCAADSIKVGQVPGKGKGLERGEDEGGCRIWMDAPHSIMIGGWRG
jgi:hypothetical protein